MPSSSSSGRARPISTSPTTAASASSRCASPVAPAPRSPSQASRDVTVLAKRAIFLLHRLVIDADADPASAAARGRQELRPVQALYASLRPELAGERFWRYQRQVSPGLQEYIEALSFAHYLEHGSLITFDQVQQSLADPDGAPYFPLAVSDYLLGLSDLTGELMRFAISAVARRGGRAKAIEVCAFVRACKAGTRALHLSTRADRPSDFECLVPYVRDLSKKQAVTAQSLEKIENAAYAIVVRSSEYALPQEMLDDIVAQSVSKFSHDDKIE
ncbi:hypothetical protein C0993_012271 [Termitomyces sp. T159_Od127]|nr:hypothetical protein C0993_012271 [Termitomyces sp. T159_Od127]